MIVWLIALWSLCAIYFTRLLYKKNMKVASILVALLYGYVLVWVYLIFFIDVGDVGFDLTRMHESSPYCGVIYRAFNSVSVGMNGFTNEFLTAIAAISLLIAASSFGVILIGSVRMVSELARLAKKSAPVLSSAKGEQKPVFSLPEYKGVPLIKRFCRANC